MERMFRLPNYSKLQTSFSDVMKIILDMLFWLLLVPTVI